MTATRSEARVDRTTDRPVLIVNDPAYPQYTGRYYLPTADAQLVRLALGSFGEDESAGRLEWARDWLDEHAEDVRRAE